MVRVRSRVLLVDALINLVLGVALLEFELTAAWLGIPHSSSAFYPTILGAVLFGIGIALVWEAYRGESASAGLGIAGAIAINLSGGTVLTLWLLFGDLSLPLRGQAILWILALALFVVSGVELAAQMKR